MSTPRVACKIAAFATKLIVLSSLPLTAVASSDVHEEVRCREIAFSLSAEARDTDRFTAFLDPDARFVGQSVQRGPDVIAKAWAPFLDPDPAGSMPRIRWRPRFVEVLESGRLALTRGPYLVETIDEHGNPVEQWGVFNSVWRQDAAGDWWIVFDAGNPGAGPISDEDRALLDADPGCDFSGA